MSVLVSRAASLALVLWILAFGSYANADIVLPTLPAGTQYRIVFLSQGVTEAKRTDIGYYNAFVTTEANANSQLAALNTTWHAIGSTASISARENTSTLPSTDPLSPNGEFIFRLDGQKVANNYNELWSGAIQNSISVDQFGIATTTLTAWTGTNNVGLAVAGAELGTTTPVEGLANATDSQWINFHQPPAFFNQNVYAISGVLTAVPEPCSMALGLVALSTIMAAERFRRRAVDF
jgi:hypothetical protein